MNRVDTGKVLDAVKLKYGLLRDLDLARKLGVTKSAISNWRKSGAPRLRLLSIIQEFSLNLNLPDGLVHNNEVNEPSDKYLALSSPDPPTGEAVREAWELLIEKRIAYLEKRLSRVEQFLKLKQEK